jgi:hypothetical protein
MDLPQNEEKHQQPDEAANTLANEIESCKDFGYTQREENGLLFNKMLSECVENEDYVRAVSSRDDYF